MTEDDAGLTDLHDLAGEIENCAVLLDVDGTILDLAPTPREVFVPAELRQTLARLRERTRGALAFVSGRSIGELDLIFAPLSLAAIGSHGAEMRFVPDGEIQVESVQPLPTRVKQRFAAIAEGGPGILVEDKIYSIALHYRLAPEKESFVHRMAATIREDIGAHSLELLPGKSVLEIKQAGFDKGTAVRKLMSFAPFRGRRPIFIGDDTTDEPVFLAMPELGGLGYSVGRGVPGIAGHFDRPSDVRRCLEALALGTTP